MKFPATSTAPCFGASASAFAPSATRPLTASSRCSTVISSSSPRHRALQADGGLCSLGGGTVDPATGDCVVCLGENNCGCILSTETFGVTCSNFCTTAVYQSLEQEFCGTASCVVAGGTSSTCEGYIDFLNEDSNKLTFTLTCHAGGICTCDQAAFAGSPCAECTGSLSGYDCGNVPNGPVRQDSTTITGNATVSPTASLDRWYHSDDEFTAQVAQQTMNEASTASNIRIGAAVASVDSALQEYVPKHYNLLVAENSMKWNNLLANDAALGVYDFTTADAMVNYAKKQDNVHVHGHTLIWGRVRGQTYPEAVALQTEQSSTPKETLTEIMQDHTKQVCNHYRPSKVQSWDVVNEHLTSRIDGNIFYTTFGHDYVPMAFEMAKKECGGETRLVWNEAMSEFGFDNEQVLLWFKLLRKYKDARVRIDTIGVQGHNINKKHNLDELDAFLTRMVDDGYSVQITELDARITLFMNGQEDDDGSTDPFQLQGEFLAAYAATCFKHGDMCKGVTMWGKDDNSTWFDGVFPATKPNLPLLLDEEGFPKPAYLAIREELGKVTSSGTALQYISGTAATAVVTALSSVWWGW